MDDHLEAGYRAKAIRKDSQDGGSNGTTWGDITKESEEMQIEGAEETTRLKNVWRRISFRSDPVDETPICIVILLLDQAGESIGERRDRRQENAQDTEKFLEAMQERVPRVIYGLEPEKAGLTA